MSRLETRPRNTVQDSRQDQDIGSKTQDKTKTLKSRSRDISSQDMKSRDYITASYPIELMGQMFNVAIPITSTYYTTGSTCQSCVKLNAIYMRVVKATS